jgi:hypothetical protein
MIEPVEVTLIDDIYLKLESNPESADENDDFSSVKSQFKRFKSQAG